MQFDFYTNSHIGLVCYFYFVLYGKKICIWTDPPQQQKKEANKQKQLHFQYLQLCALDGNIWVNV